MVWFKFLLLGFGYYLFAYTGGNSFLVGLLFLCYAFLALLANYGEFCLDSMHADLERSRQEKLSTLEVGSSAYLAERAKHRAHDEAEHARRVRNRKAAAEREDSDDEHFDSHSLPSSHSEPYLHSEPYSHSEPYYNINGLPMFGGFDIAGNPYGTM